MNSILTAAALGAALVASSAAPASAAGEILITQAKALAGNVSPGDAPGFPVTLAVPGLYIFAGNVFPTAGTVGIHAAHRNVTIDLNGFELHGGGAASHGIVGNQSGTTIRNGTITGFAFDGINGSGDFWLVEDMRVVENGRYGVYPFGRSSRVLNNTVGRNGNIGIRCHHGCRVADNAVYDNGGPGVTISSGIVLGNIIQSNGGLGINAGALTGFGNNTLAGNNGAGSNPQVSSDATPIHPNICIPACP